MLDDIIIFVGGHLTSTSYYFAPRSPYLGDTHLHLSLLHLRERALAALRLRINITGDQCWITGSFVRHQEVEEKKNRESIGDRIEEGSW